MNDSIGSAHMTQGNLTTFTFDRFGNQNSALALNGGWTQVQAGIYFDTPEFTISAWIMPQQIGSWAKLFDFGNGQWVDNIYLSLSNGSDCVPIVVIDALKLFAVKSTQRCTLNQWQLLTATFDGQTITIYINATLTAANTLSSNTLMPRLIRTLNYIGKSNSIADGYSYSIIDELRFYNKSLTQCEISELMFDNGENNITACMSTTTKAATSATTSSTTTSTTTSG
jgi:hypothetical protein